MNNFLSLSFTNTLYLLLGLIRRLLRLCRAQIMRLCHRSTILVWAVWSVICRHLWMDVISTGVGIHVFRGREKTASYPSLCTFTLLFQRLWQSDFFGLFVLTKNNLPCVLTGFPISAFSWFALVVQVCLRFSQQLVVRSKM